MPSKNKINVVIKVKDNVTTVAGEAIAVSSSRYTDTDNEVSVNLNASSLPEKMDFVALRKWWHYILYTYGKYSCCAFILALPSDKHAINYLTEFGKELDLLSGENCLVIALSDNQLMRFGFDEALWKLAVNQQISNGYSLKVAKFFKIKLSELPCIVIFQDIRSTEHLVVSLQEMEIEEISQKMRSLFSVIQSAVAQKANPLLELKKQGKKKELQKAGLSFVGKLQSFAGKTFETAVEAVIQSTIKNA